MHSISTEEKGEEIEVHSKTDMTVFSILLFLSILLAISPRIQVKAAEPTLETILDSLGFTNRIITTVETFPAGMCEITLYAEYAGYRDQNTLSWYKIGRHASSCIVF